jgi:hypothetical protein
VLLDADYDNDGRSEVTFFSKRSEYSDACDLRYNNFQKKVELIIGYRSRYWACAGRGPQRVRRRSIQHISPNGPALVSECRHERHSGTIATPTRPTTSPDQDTSRKRDDPAQTNSTAVYKCTDVLLGGV